MGLLKKKSKERPIPSATVLSKLSDLDLYMHVERTLMDSAQMLSQFRTATNEDREAMLVWLFDLSHNLMLGYEEFDRRLRS